VEIRGRKHRTGSCGESFRQEDGMKPITHIDESRVYRGRDVSRIAAFFDIDGTLLPLPSLERRFFAELRRDGEIPFTNYLRWATAAIRLAPSGILRSVHANKMHLRHVRVRTLAPGHFTFFPAAIRRVGWHASQGHSVILISGTLDLLARQAALALTLRLAMHGVMAKIGVCATRAERIDGQYTGRVVDAANFAEEKMLAIRRIAQENGFDLARCYAYSDSAHDRWMLGAVGRPAAANPSPELRRIAKLRHWPVYEWAADETIEDITTALTRRTKYDSPLFRGIPSEKAQ
jgi:HAD superfamily phosphoserine phosphatase-like hydrolase